MDEFFCISQCTIEKEIWYTLVFTHEGTTEVKRSRLNILCQEYELFRIQPEELIMDMQKSLCTLSHLKKYDPLRSVRTLTEN